MKVFRQRPQAGRWQRPKQDLESSGDWQLVAPVSTTSSSGLDAPDAAKAKSGLACLVLPYLLLSPWLEQAGILSGVVGQFIAATGFAYLLYRLLTFRRWNDEMPYAAGFFLAFGTLLLELGIENFFIWAVSASDLRKYEAVQPLQDNGLIVLEAAMARLPLLRRVLEPQGVAILHKLIALILMAVSVLLDQVPFSGFGMMTRVVACIQVSRAIRTMAFMLTVLPGSWPGCYARRFPPVPQDWWQFLKVGFGSLRSSGGCNDLIISGHATIYTVVPLAYSTYYPGWTARLLWLLVARTCIRAPITHQHYSVDMFLAVVVSALVWHWVAWTFPARPARRRHPTEPPDARGPVQWVLTALIFLVLAILGWIIIIGGA